MRVLPDCKYQDCRHRVNDPGHDLCRQHYARFRERQVDRCVGRVCGGTVYKNSGFEFCKICDPPGWAGVGSGSGRRGERVGGGSGGCLWLVGLGVGAAGVLVWGAVGVWA